MQPYREITVEPLTGSVGAEVRAGDVRTLGDAAFGEIRRALRRHLVLLFRDQELTVPDQCAFSRRFGTLIRLPYVQHMADYPDVIAVLKQAEDRNVGVFGGDWHSDFSFLPAPPMGSVLYAKQVPAVGGDTLWANLCDAYDALPADLKTLLDGEWAVHTGAPYGQARAPAERDRASDSIRMARGDPEADREIVHPAVCVHPETGRRSVFVNPIYTRRLSAMSAAESQPILQRIYDHCVRPEFCCRVRWAPGSLAVWDNRCTLHYAENDYDGHRRLMYRTAIAGDPPLPAGPA